MIRIANGAGFLGDNLDAPRLLVQSAAVDYLTLEYLAELTMSILARVRQQDPDAGFASDFIDVLQSLGPSLCEQSQLRVITNAGGVNPVTCARAAAQVLVSVGLPDQPIAIVSGDDLLARLKQLQDDGCTLENLDTGTPLAELSEPIVSANAYLGARPISEALSGGARIVITGRVADASLTVGPAMHQLGWDWTDWDKVAAATVAGHLIECGAQVTGGYSTNWKDHNLLDVGYPIAELDDDGRMVITKPPASGGVVNRQTVVEQMVYEIGDPAHYLTPDVEVDFSTVEVQQIGIDRVEVSSATGRHAPDSYKVSLAYLDGFMASGQMLVYGEDCIDKARACADMILARVKRSGYDLAKTHVEFLGQGDALPRRDRPTPSVGPHEVVLRVTAWDPRREPLQRFSKEFAPLITSGPAGLAGYATGRSAVRPVFAFWPTLLPKEFVKPLVDVRTAKEWIPLGG